MILPRSRLGQTGCPLNQVRCGDGSNLLAHPQHEFLSQLLCRLDADVKRHIRIDALALDVMRVANDGCLSDLVVGNQRRLNLCRSHPVARDIDDVIHPASDPVVAILIAPRAVTGKNFAGIGREVGIDEALMVAVDGPHLSGPRVAQDENAFGSALLDVSIAVDDCRFNAEKRARCRTGLERGSTR